MYVVLIVNRMITLDLFGSEQDVPLCYAEGMVGAIPVFETREQAEAFADGNYAVVEVITAEAGDGRRH